MSNTRPAEWNRAIIDEFRANRGQVGGPFEGAPLVLLTTTGAKTGRRRTVPLLYNTDGERLLIVASKGGAPTHPAWSHNLVAHPRVTLEVGTETFEAMATVVRGAERDRLFARHAAQYPGFAEYQAKTTRTIPVIALERVR